MGACKNKNTKPSAVTLTAQSWLEMYFHRSWTSQASGPNVTSLFKTPPIIHYCASAIKKKGKAALLEYETFSWHPSRTPDLTPCDTSFPVPTFPLLSLNSRTAPFCTSGLSPPLPEEFCRVPGEFHKLPRLRAAAHNDSINLNCAWMQMQPGEVPLGGHYRSLP